MTDILIAYNSDYADHAHNMFESCADKARQIAFDHQKSYTLLTTPNLTTDHVDKYRESSSVCDSRTWG